MNGKWGVGSLDGSTYGLLTNLRGRCSCYRCDTECDGTNLDIKPIIYLRIRVRSNVHQCNEDKNLPFFGFFLFWGGTGSRRGKSFNDLFQSSERPCGWAHFLIDPFIAREVGPGRNKSHDWIECWWNPYGDCRWSSLTMMRFGSDSMASCGVLTAQPSPTKPNAKGEGWLNIFLIRLAY